jgi:hypothetical protein
MGILITSAGVGGGWQIVNAISKITPTLVYPLGDGTTTANARNRRAPSAILWEIPVVVQGGAWPFHYELTTAPSGAVIGEDLPVDWLTNGFQDYGVISWSNPTVGTHSFAGTVYDQLGAEVPFSFSLEVIDRENTTYFMFLNASTGDDSTGTGAFSSPKQTIAGWYGPDKADSTHQSKQIFYRTGTYLSTAAPVFGGTGQQVDMTSGKPKVHVAYPGESVIMDCANTAYYDWESSAHDIHIAGFTWQNPTVSEASAVRKQFLRMVTGGERIGIWRNHFTGNEDASANNSNSSAVMIDPGLSATSSYHFLRSNVFDNLDEMDFVLCYGTHYLVFEDNEVINGYTADEGWGCFLKARNIDYITVRANRGVGSGITLPLLHFSSFTDGADELRDHIEACFNCYGSTDASVAAVGAGAIAIGQSLEGSTGNHYGVFYSYRNNLKHPHFGFIGVQAGTFSFEYDCIEHSGVYANSMYSFNSTVSPDFDNCAIETSLFDSSLLLTGTPRTTYYGTHGCELEYA